MATVDKHATARNQHTSHAQQYRTYKTLLWWCKTHPTTVGFSNVLVFPSNYVTNNEFSNSQL